MKAFYKEKKRGAKPYSAKTKAEVLRRVDADLARGLGFSDILPHVVVSESTIHRWRAERENFAAAAYSQTLIDRISGAIGYLCSNNNDRKNRVEAMITFVNWLRWPHRPKYASTGVVSFCAALARGNGYHGSLAEMPRELRELICKHLSADDLLDIFVGRNFDFPVYNYSPIFDRDVDDRDVLAGIIYLLRVIGISDNRRKSASLSKAFHLINTQAVSFYWYVGRRTLEKLWQEYGSASPFLYVEKYHSKLRWTVEPGQEKFVSNFEYVFDNLKDVRLYFQQCKAIVAETRQLLNAKALEGVSFPDFPADLAAVSPPRPPMTKAIATELSDYSRHSKYLW